MDEARDVHTNDALECLVKNFTQRVIKAGAPIPFTQIFSKDLKRDDIANKGRRSHKATAQVQNRAENLNTMAMDMTENVQVPEISYFCLRKCVYFIVVINWACKSQP